MFPTISGIVTDVRSFERKDGSKVNSITVSMAMEITIPPTMPVPPLLSTISIMVKYERGSQYGDRYTAIPLEVAQALHQANGVGHAPSVKDKVS